MGFEVRLTKMEKDIEFLKQRLDELNKKIEELVDSITVRNKHNVKLEAIINNIQSMIKEMNEKITKITDKIVDQDKQIAMLEQKVQQHEQKLSAHDKLIYTMAGATVTLTGTLIVWIVRTMLGG